MSNESEEIKAYKSLSEVDKDAVDIIFDVLAKFEELGYEMDITDSKSLALYDKDEPKRKKSYITSFNEALKLLTLSNPYIGIPSTGKTEPVNPYGLVPPRPLPDPKALIADMLINAEDKKNCLRALGRKNKSNLDYDRESINDFWFENYLM